MDIKAIVNNIKNKGFKWTWNSFVAKKTFVKNKSKFTKYYTERPFLKMNDSEKHIFFQDMLNFEKDLKKSNPHVYEQYLADMKRVYIKKYIPQLYAKVSNLPVSNKIIFMENGNSPSPSNAHISKVLKKDGRYDIHMTGLKIREVSYLEFYENALKFIEDMGTAKAVFLSTANDLLSYIEVRSETKIIQLWHGVGVLKKIGYSTIKSKQFGMSKKTREEYNQYKNYSYVTIAAAEQSWIFEEAMNISKESGIILPVGISRTDVFYDTSYIENAYNKFYNKFPQIKGKKIILYAPTFRGEVENAQAPNKLNINLFAESLSDDYVLLIKHHSLSKNIPPIPEEWQNSFAFDMTANKVLTIEQLLTVADICITDYSSIAFEYAIMEKPLIFYAYDLEEYIDDRGMYYNYDEITPGPVCKTNGAMIDYIININSEFDKSLINEFKNKYVNACDGHATERTIKLIEHSHS